VEKSVELGVARLVPLETVRGVAQPADRALDRLRRTVIEASKQCGRNRLMEVCSPQRLNGFLGSAPDEALRLVAHPGDAARPLCHWLDQSGLRPVCIAIGPEGGFSEEEIAEAVPAGPLVTLGPRILRIETAALALAAAVALAWNP
jgi:16S rRNA (uracil1498-N3)-methyltransferase